MKSTLMILLIFIFTGNFVCEFCHLPFVSKAKFLRHRRIHTEENPYECVHCHQTFAHHVDLRNHRNEHHMTNKTFKCNFCPKTFSARAELKGHLWRHTGKISCIISSLFYSIQYRSFLGKKLSTILFFVITID